MGLLYDALIIGIGNMVDESVLKGLSVVRYLSHGALIPLLISICGYVLNLNSKKMNIVWIVTAVIIVLGIAQAIVNDLVIEKVGNITRYASSDNTPSWAKLISRFLSFGTVLPLIAVGIYAIIKEKNFYIFLSGF